ncbi:hypothetical protein WJX72_001171 [[Myrmecia] bisecta]|uniref:Malate dehydrogenase n=1 Tax=[Myrmecia] bisecta TaxID=41462 RepID=A0AAW1QP37_9CHLO
MQRLAVLSGHLRPVSGGEASALERQATAAPSTLPPGAKPKVAVLGAGGGIGQPLAMLFKLHPGIGELSLYDVVGTAGVAADISHIDTSVKVSHFTGPDKLAGALYGCHLVIIPAGVPRKPGMTRDDLFNINAGIVKTLCEGVAKYCPDAWVAIISNPVNSTVPIAAEVFKRAGTFNQGKLLGVTKLDVCRANAFVAEAIGVPPEQMDVPVVGGHAGITILPLLSKATPRVELSPEKAQALTERIQNAGTEVVEAKAGKGSATLSMAYAAYKFGESCLRAMTGAEGVTEYAYVASNVTQLPYFASKLRLGINGVEEYYPLGRLNELEEKNLAALQDELQKSIEKGVEFARKA